MMTAFGPYKEKETIDFEQLKDHRLFAISGATGSGKTTIFDGISFALYGSASGSDRDNVTMLRSDFAEEDVHTEVELLFEIRDKQYRIMRRLGHVKKGNKTKTGDKIAFYHLEDGHEIPVVERQIVSMIDEKVQEIIGLTPDQFKQIVMLPQGEFRKLLTSETENKEAILRRLFKTEKYQQLNHLLKEKRDTLAQAFKNEEQMKEHYIKSIHTSLENREHAPLFQTLAMEYYNTQQVIDGLHTEVTFYEKELAYAKENYTAASKAHEQQQAWYHQSLALNEQFASLKKNEIALAEMNEQAEQIAKMETGLQEAEQAKAIQPYENQLKMKRKEVESKKTAIKILEGNVQAAETAAREMKKAYDFHAGKQSERDQLSREVEKLAEVLPVVLEAEKNRLELEAQEKKLKQSQQRMTEAKQQVERQTAKLEALQKEVKAIEERLEILPNKKEEVHQLRHKFTVLRDYRKLFLAQETFKPQVEKKEKAYKIAKQKYHDFEAVWLQNQAAMLAHELHEGEHCPVCGSTEHPRKAQDQKDLVTRELLEEVKAEEDKAHKIYHEDLLTYRANEQQLAAIAEKIAEYEIALEEVPNQLEEISAYGVQLNNEVIELENSAKEGVKLKASIDAVQKTMKQAALQEDQHAMDYQAALTAFTTLKATFKERMRNIAEEMKDVKKLEAQIAEKQAVKGQLDEAWETAQKNAKMADEAKTKADTNLVNGEKQLRELTEALSMIESSFVLELRKANFATEALYEAAKTKIPQIEAMRETVTNHKQTVATLTQQISDLKENLKGKEKIDTKRLANQVEESKALSEKAFHHMNDMQKSVDTAISILNNIIKIKDQSEQLERKLMSVIDLHDVMRGRNEQKLSFERYVQIDYLEQIMHAANERLRDLSNGQYYLMKSERLESGGRQSGLSIDVYDAYTGQTRDVKTLSGGEKFNASLSLALGMSDVIQSFQGNITIDTMFIDEGFGSLDEESLTKAIDALIDLQKTGRMIGVISHVEELKNMFPATLEVRKTKEGLSKTRFVLK